MSHKKSESELDAARCSARSKETGERCRRWAVAGCRVCTVHGAGVPKRRQFLGGPDGRERKDPRAARLKHGLYSKRLPPEVARVVAEFQGDQEALFDLKAVAARLWTMLVRCDEVEVSLADGDLRDPKVAADVVMAIDAVTKVCRELGKVIVAQTKLSRRNSGLTERDLGPSCAASCSRCARWPPTSGCRGTRSPTRWRSGCRPRRRRWRCEFRAEAEATAGSSSAAALTAQRFGGWTYRAERHRAESPRCRRVVL